MCGIIGYFGKKDALDVVIEGLKKLEYRGYDSVGVAYFNGTGYEIKRQKGKIRDLEPLVRAEGGSGIAIGHTRWATHGEPSDENAHPHTSDSVVLVHNGIIENYRELKELLQTEGYRFTSKTDTEAIAHLVDLYHRDAPLEEAVRRAARQLKGAFSVVVVSKKEPGKMVGLRKESPLVLGIGEGEFFLASDVPAFLQHTRRVVFLDDGEMVVVQRSGYRIETVDGQSVDKSPVDVPWSPALAEKAGYKHFMHKEIHEQPVSLANTLRGRVDRDLMTVVPEEFGLETAYLKGLQKIYIVACGTSWHAALVGKYIIEALARVPVEVDLGSEFRYRNPLIAEGDLFIAITQSGETADTLAAQREAKSRGARTLSICNVLGATSAREADGVFYLHCGPEIGVASTKAFTAQMVALYLFGILLAKAKGTITHEQQTELLQEVIEVPDKVEQALKREKEVIKIADAFHRATDFLYMGRGILYPVALEGALKLKEISYIHAEGYASGEMKHGPLALVDESMPTLFLVQSDKLREKVFSNIEEVRSRGGQVIIVTTDRVTDLPEAPFVLRVPSTNTFLEPVLLSIPLQLLAYHIGVMRGYDVDQPRNLAKSVTVE